MINRDDMIFLIELLLAVLVIAGGFVWAQELGFLKITEDDDAE